MKFQPGVSGNPGGRKPGIPSKTAKLRAEIEDQIPAILETLTTLAVKGDTAAAKLLLDRALPPLRPESRALPAGIPTDPREIPQAVADLRLTAEQGQALLDLAGRVAALESLVEMEARLGALEALLKQSNA